MKTKKHLFTMLVAVLFFQTGLTSYANGTVLDQARSIRKDLIRQKNWATAECAGQSIRAAADFLFLVPTLFMTTMDLVGRDCDRKFKSGKPIQLAHAANLKATDLKYTVEDLDKVISFLKKNEKCYVRLDEIRNNNSLIRKIAGRKFKREIFQMKLDTETSIADTIERIHQRNLTGMDGVALQQNGVRNYETVRGACKK